MLKETYIAPGFDVNVDGYDVVLTPTLDIPEEDLLRLQRILSAQYRIVVLVGSKVALGGKCLKVRLPAGRPSQQTALHVCAIVREQQLG